MLIDWVSPLIKAQGWIAIADKRFGHAFQKGKLRAIVSGDFESDGLRWIHLSVSLANRIPTWEELVKARDELLGTEAKCIHIVSRASEHVNYHPYRMHLWHCVDRDPLPDFTRGRGII